MSIEYFNYLASFSDGTVKTGITSSPFFRLQDYIQEANRNSKKVNGFKVTAPSADKRTALDIETAICLENRHDAIQGHREWFFCEYDKKNSCRSNFILLSLQIDSVWFGKNIRSREGIKAISSQKLYSKFIAFAEQLGKGGERISATRATKLAEGFIHA